jgi:hypothetical protein
MSCVERSNTASVVARLKRAVVALSGWLGVVASLQTNTNGNMSESSEIASIVHTSHKETNPARPDDVMKDSCVADGIKTPLTLAEEELSTAIRILDRFKVPPHSAELEAYLDAVSAAVEDVDEVSIDKVHCVASNLSAARSQFAEDVKKLSEYLGIVQAVHPSRDGHPTPSRFVRWAEPESELPFDLSI